MLFVWYCFQEDVGQLLQRIQVLMEQFNLDEVIGEGKRQPVLEQYFCVWLLLVLNELRMQVGAAIGDLAHWLMTLMPVDMYESGLRPCPNNLASFLLSTTRCSKDLTEDVLEGAIPAWVFVANETFHATPTGKVGITHDNDNEEEDLCWEDYLHHVNLDALVGGKATPVSAIDFTQGLVYAVWRTSQLLGEGEQQVVDWLRQLSPLPLSKEQLENLVIMIGQLHIHLEEHPEDIHELECAIIPQLQNEHCASQSSSDGEKVANSPLRVEAYNSCVSEEDGSNVQAYNSCKSKKDANTHIYISPKSKKGKSNVWSTKKMSAMKNKKGSPTLQTPRHKKTKRLKSLVSNMNVKDHKSNYSKKTTVSSPSQIIASEGDTQSDNHPDDSDATLVHSNTNITLAKPESMLDGAINQIPLDSTAICEPNPTVLSHSRSKYITEQCAVVTAPTISSVKSKETKVTSQLSKKTVVTNGSSTGTATNNQLCTETVAMIESCEDTVAIPNLDEDIVTTTKTSKETETTTKTLEESITNDDPDKEIADISGTSEVTTATIESNEAYLNNKTSEKTVTIIGTSEQTTATTEFSEVTVNTVESSKETVTTTEPTGKTSEETAATTGSAKDTVTTAELNEETVVFRDTLEGTKGISRTSEETVATTKPAEDTLAIIDTSEKNASPIEPTEKTVATTELSNKSAIFSGASEETVVTSGISEETAGTSGSLKEMAVTDGTSEESAVTSGSSKVMAVTSGISEEMTVTNVTSEESAVTSGTPEETAVTKRTSEEIAVTNRTSEETAVSSGISVETAVFCESFEEVSTTEESLENTSMDTTVLVTKKSATVTPLEETGTNNGTSGKIAATSESCKETRTTRETPEEIIAANEPTKNTVISVGSSEEIAGTVEAFKVSVASPEQPKGTLTTLGLGQDIEVTSQCPGDVMVTTHDTTVIQKSSVVIATNYHSPKNVGTNVHSKETVSTTPTLSIADGNITTATICTQATRCEMNDVITSTQHSASSPLTNTIVTADTGSMANTTQLTIAPQEAVVIKNTASRTVKAEISKPQITQCANALKTLRSSTTLVSPPSKSISDSTGQHSVITVSQNSMNSKKISRQALGHGSHAVLKRTNEDGQNITNLQESALRKSPETQTEFEQKNEHHFDNLKQKGSSSSSKRSFTGISNNPTKVCIVTVPKKGNTLHQMEDSVGHAKKKDCLKVVHKYKTDTPFKNNVVLPPKNSKDMELIQSKKELSQEVPLIVSSTKHRSERFCISSKVKTHESHKGENSLRSKKESKRLYQNTCKERLRTERVDNKNSHGCSPIHFESHQEGREDNNNTEIPSLPSSSASSKSVVRVVSADHIRDKLEHTNECEKYDLKDTNACTIQKTNEKIPTMNDTKQKESYVERIPGNDNKVPDASVKKVKNTSVENYCDKDKVDEIPENYIHKQIKTNKKCHQPVTPKSHEEVMLKKKKFHEKTPGKSLPLEENKQSIKGKFTSSITTPEKSMNKSASGVTPSKQKVACRTPKGLPEKKQKLTFEELMNYDAA